MTRQGKWAPYGREISPAPRRAISDTFFDPCEGREHRKFFYTQVSRLYNNETLGAWHCEVCGRRLGDWWILPPEGTDKPATMLTKTAPDILRSDR